MSRFPLPPGSRFPVVKALCHALGISRATYYRRLKAKPATKARPASPRRLSDDERELVIDTLCEERFADLSLYQVHAALLQRGKYLCSIRTMYRILHQNHAVKERRDQSRHPAHEKPQLTATAPLQVWTWDITKLPGPHKGVLYCLYVILDLFSRFVVSWTLEESESAAAAKRLVEHGIKNQDADPQSLTIHADRGAPMTSNSLYALFDHLGVTGSHSRPRVSNDNAYSEAQFKTLKYDHRYPKRFQSFEDARLFLQGWFQWYNNEHYHAGIALFTPKQVHDGSFQNVHQTRQATLDAAYDAHPERFVKGRPISPLPPQSVSINPDSPLDDSPSDPECKITTLTPCTLPLLNQDAIEAPQSNQGEKS